MAMKPFEKYDKTCRELLEESEVKKEQVRHRNFFIRVKSCIT